jgi:hypothetical protein
MLRQTSIALIAIVSINSYAMSTNKFQTESPELGQNQPHIIKNQPIVLNSQVDDIKELDPRLKSIIIYAHYESIPVQINYYSKQNYRYAAKVMELFKSNKVNSVINLVISSNLIDQNLIKIYLQESMNANTK